MPKYPDRYQVTVTVARVDSKHEERVELRPLPFGETAAEFLAFLATANGAHRLEFRVKDDTSATGRFKPKAGQVRGSAGFYITGKVEW